MKRSEFVRQLLADGCVLLRYGSRHDIYLNPATGKKQSVPRHAEIDDRLAKHIRKYLGLAAES
jgi:predicted RNA binding protein YcfA (HicA-like mRNA interferase family)